METILTGSLGRMLNSKRTLEEARMILDMLENRLREGGPEMSRAEIRERVRLAAGKINQLAPRSILRDEPHATFSEPDRAGDRLKRNNT